MGERAVPLDGQGARAILDQLPLGVTVTDERGRLRFVNEAAAELFGVPVEDLLGGSALELTVAAADTTAMIDLMANVAAGHPWIGRFPLTGPDGRRIDGWFAATRVGDDLVSVGGDAADIEQALGIDSTQTLVARSQEEAEEANRLLTTLLDAVPVAMGFFDREARLVRVNRALAAINDRTPADYVGATMADVAAGAEEVFRPLVQRAFDTGRALTDRLLSVEPVTRPGDLRHWSVSLFPVLLRGSVAWVGATVVDVTDWQRHEEERSRLLDAEKVARRAAEEGAQRLARLQVVTARLAEATATAKVAEIVIAHGAEGIGATMAALMMASPDGSSLETVAATGFAPDAVAQFERVSVDADVPVAEAARTGDIVFISSRLERDRRWPALANVTTVSVSSAAVPLLLDGRLVGAVTLGWPIWREFTQADRDFLLALGRQCVLALERVRLYEAERTARSLAEEATERMAFLAEASRVLASSLDYSETLPRVARLAVEEIADVCALHLVQDGEVRVAAAAHRDRERHGALSSAVGEIPDQPRFLGKVLVTGDPLVVEDWSTVVVDRFARSDQHARDIDELALQSLIAVPLVLSGRALGVLSLGLATPGRRYTAADVPFVQDLAARVAVAVENSLVHEARAEVARTLQRSLLPPVRPHVPGLEVASRYHSAGEIEVGGDFFDVFPSGDGRWGAVIGDVCGRGVGAASLTALARYTVRAGAIDVGEPAQVLRLLNRAILDTDVGERFCTIIHVIVEPHDDGARLTVASGGHPLPLLVRADGSVEEVGVPGTAIGLFEEIDLHEVEVDLGAGEAIVLFTDGYTEARAPDGRFAPDLLEAALAGAAGGDAERLADAVDRAVLAFEGGRPRDDMALLILRVPASRAARRR
ncbi:MAG TPA: SpoIIE family protein phosphatase [Acidimicrobiales bacterium]|nr:SpoIIE family protein phosphatase [Acidimicrobiales bacterium]